AYTKNTVSAGCPAVGDGLSDGVFQHYQEKVEGATIRKRAESFKDYYSQAALFWHSMSDVEREHIVAAFRFELGKVTDKDIRARAVEQLNHVDHDLAELVATGVGVATPEPVATPAAKQTSPALSQVPGSGDTIATRKVAVLVADGVDG